MYKVKLQNFEGPLDLLLFFVRKDELDIYDIPIAHITKSYLEYLHLMQELNLDIAAEFILMAATLMRIKVKSMLPRNPDEEEEEEALDPREELTRRLIEYRQFKEASKSLAELDEYWRSVYRRSYFNFDLIPQSTGEPVGLKDITFFDLLAAYKKALAKKPKIIYHNIERLNVTIEQQQVYIFGFFGGHKCYLFTDLCASMSKIEIVVTFLAMLDLIKRGEIAVKQATIFDDIWVYKPDAYVEDEMEAAETAEEMRIGAEEHRASDDQVSHEKSVATIVGDSNKEVAFTLDDSGELVPSGSEFPEPISVAEFSPIPETKDGEPSEDRGVSSGTNDAAVSERGESKVSDTRMITPSPMDENLPGDVSGSSLIETSLDEDERSSVTPATGVSATVDAQHSAIQLDSNPIQEEQLETRVENFSNLDQPRERNEDLVQSNQKLSDTGTSIIAKESSGEGGLGSTKILEASRLMERAEEERENIQSESESGIRRLFMKIVTFVKRMFSPR